MSAKATRVITRALMTKEFGGTSELCRFVQAACDPEGSGEADRILLGVRQTDACLTTVIGLDVFNELLPIIRRSDLATAVVADAPAFSQGQGGRFAAPPSPAKYLALGLFALMEEARANCESKLPTSSHRSIWETRGSIRERRIAIYAANPDLAIRDGVPVKEFQDYFPSKFFTLPQAQRNSYMVSDTLSDFARNAAIFEALERIRTEREPPIERVERGASLLRRAEFKTLVPKLMRRLEDPTCPIPQPFGAGGGCPATHALDLRGVWEGNAVLDAGYVDIDLRYVRTLMLLRQATRESAEAFGPDILALEFRSNDLALHFTTPVLKPPDNGPFSRSCDNFVWPFFTASLPLGLVLVSGDF